MTQPTPLASDSNSPPSLFDDHFLDDATLDLPSVPEQLSIPRGVPRVKRPVRDQIEYCELCLDDLVPLDHPVRAVWTFVMAQDLSAMYDKIEAVEGDAGRSAIDPRILMALWLFATVEGVGSAREIERLTTRDAPFRWICGGVSVNHNRLSQFRTGSSELLDEVLTNSVAVLMQQNLVTLTRVAQDGIRVRANAGKSSFRREASLQQLHEEAKEQIEALKPTADEQPSEASARQKAARHRAATEREARIAKALLYLPVKEVEKKQKKGIDPYAPLPNDAPEIAAWRQRMGLPESKEIYKERASTAEWVNAQARNRGLQQFLVRGLQKVKDVAMWFAIVHNLVRALTLRPESVEIAVS